MSRQAVIFDMDGTLFKTDKVLIAALEKTFACLRGLNQWEGEAPVEQYLKIMGVPLPEVWQNLLPMHEQQLHDKVNRIFHIHLFREIRSGNGELYPNVLSHLETMAKDYRLFIASNGLHSYLLEIINHFKLTDYFQGVYSIEACPSGKKGDLVAMIIDDHHLSSAIMVGDRSSDILAGKQNNLYTVGCSWGFAAEGELDEADVVMKSFVEIEDILETQKVHI
ncbi:HAD hydrolase-like protein [Bacillus sp. AK031]